MGRPHTAKEPQIRKYLAAGWTQERVRLHLHVGRNAIRRIAKEIRVENVHTLMVFVPNQAQAVVLQYKTPMAANDAQDLCVDEAARSHDQPMIMAAELTLKPADVQMALVQDIDAATEGNVASMVKNNIIQALTQMRTQNEIESDPKVKAAVVRSQLQQGAQGGAFRQ